MSTSTLTRAATAAAVTVPGIPTVDRSVSEHPVTFSAATVARAMGESARCEIGARDALEVSTRAFIASASIAAAALDSGQVSARDIATAGAELVKVNPGFGDTGSVFVSAGTVLAHANVGRIVALPGDMPSDVTPRTVQGWLQTKGLKSATVAQILATEVTCADAVSAVKRAAGAAKVAAKRAAEDKRRADQATTDAAQDVAVAERVAEIVTGSVSPTAEALLTSALGLIRQAAGLEWTDGAWSLVTELIDVLNAKEDAEPTSELARRAEARNA